MRVMRLEMAIQIETDSERGGVGRFLRLWMLLAFAYALIKFAFDLAVFGWIDLRGIAFLELAVIPLGQSAVFWVVTRRIRGEPPEP